MAGLRVLSTDELAPVVHALSEVSWPADEAALDALAAHLGWQASMRRRRSEFHSGLPVAPDHASGVIRLGELAEVHVQVTDSIPRDGVRRADRRRLDEAFVQLRQSLSAILGKAPRRLLGSSDYRWDLLQGGRLTLQQLGGSVILILLSAKTVDQERATLSSPVSPVR